MSLDMTKPDFGVCEQQRCRPACASAQSDQHLCYLCIGKYHILTSYEQNFNFLASLCGLAGWFGSHFVGNTKDRFSRNDFCHILSYMYDMASFSHKVMILSSIG